MPRSTAVPPALLVGLLLAGCTAGPTDASAPADTPTAAPSAPASSVGDDTRPGAVRDVIAEAMDRWSLRAVIVRVQDGDDVVIEEAFGESMTGVPATTGMHFRSGAMSIPQMSTVLLQLAEEGEVELDDPIAEWLPDVPNADRVTLGQLAQMTSGYADYLWSDELIAEMLADPFREWSPEELYPFGTSRPLLYEPGTNWNYAHTDYLLLGLALEEITGTPVDELLAERVLEPLGLEETAAPGTPEIAEPVLHAYTSERRTPLGVPPGTRFIEDSTFWNPSWTLARGSMQYTDVADAAALIRAVGRGDLLDDESHDLQVAPTLRGATSEVEGCVRGCLVQDEAYTYGYGIVLTGDWIMQNPAFFGYAAAAGHQADDDLTVSVAVTYLEDAFAEDGSVPNRATSLFRELAIAIAPDRMPPGRG
ncbi:serine hydrolase domain-containing protein [Agromyces sp. H66]|uniref:serine hydrolase domain-containing protein n=1 Tax=Agromyces sp. H66 TaxID=2529859 RepID=UPI0010AB3131|nr:serine hydrolase domain-containing protein [Agromyces sp. H66]